MIGMKVRGSQLSPENPTFTSKYRKQRRTLKPHFYLKLSNAAEFREYILMKYKMTLFLTTSLFTP